MIKTSSLQKGWSRFRCWILIAVLVFSAPWWWRPLLSGPKVRSPEANGYPLIVLLAVLVATALLWFAYRHLSRKSFSKKHEIFFNLFFMVGVLPATIWWAPGGGLGDRLAIGEVSWIFSATEKIVWVVGCLWFVLPMLRIAVIIEEKPGWN